MTASTSSSTDLIGSNGRPDTLVAASAGVRRSVAGSADAAAMTPVLISTERRVSCRLAISANVGSVLVLGAGCAQASPHLI